MVGYYTVLSQTLLRSLQDKTHCCRRILKREASLVPLNWEELGKGIQKAILSTTGKRIPSLSLNLPLNFELALFIVLGAFHV